MKLLTPDTYAVRPGTLQMPNDADPHTLGWAEADRIELEFPKFTDGRAYSQAYLLRRRLGFSGELVATGDVLVDQLALMQRSGFSTAVLRADQSLVLAEQVLKAYPGYQAGAYQGDASEPAPHFARAAA